MPAQVVGPPPHLARLQAPVCSPQRSMEVKHREPPARLRRGRHTPTHRPIGPGASLGASANHRSPIIQYYSYVPGFPTGAIAHWARSIRPNLISQCTSWGSGSWLKDPMTSLDFKELITSNSKSPSIAVTGNTNLRSQAMLFQQAVACCCWSRSDRGCSQP